MNPADIPRFSGYRTPGGADFAGAQSQIQTGFGQFDVNLAIASAAVPGNSNGVVIVPIAGDFLYVDTDPAASNGVATLQFNLQQDAGAARFYAQPGEAWLTTFKQIGLSWAAQPGKFMRLLYATGDRVAPAFTASTFATIINALGAPIPIGGNLGIVQQLAGAGGLGAALLQTDTGVTYGSSFASSTNLAALTPQTIIAPGSNANGLRLMAAGLFAIGAAAQTTSILAKSSAPTTVTDGDLHLGWICLTGAANQAPMQLQRAIRIPAGLGLYVISQILDTAAQRSALFSVN